MEALIASFGIFLGAALFITPPILIIWGLVAILNHPGKPKDDGCPYIEKDVYGNARIMKQRFDANVAAFEAEQRPAYGRGNETPAYKAPAPLAIETPHLQPQAARQSEEIPMIDKWLAAGQILQDVYAELPLPKSTPQLPAGNEVEGQWVDLPRQAVLVRRNR